MVTQQQIKRWNTSFNKLSEEDKRVAIAKDVIKQIKAGKYYASTGTYVNLDVKLSDDTSLQKHFDEITCDVCALGGLFMSNVKFNNQCTYNELGCGKFLDLLKYFSKEQLFLIEIAFEGWEISDMLDFETEVNGYIDIMQGIYAGRYTLEEITDTSDSTKSKMKAAMLFGENYHDESDRLIAIMQNIVKNKGEFIP